MVPFNVDWPSFWLGGLIAVVVLGFIAFLVNWINRPGSPFRPQVVVQTTKKTPWQVVMSCAGSTMMMVGLGLLIAVLLIVALMGAELPEVAWMIAIAVVSFGAGVLVRAVMG